MFIKMKILMILVTLMNLPVTLTNPPAAILDIVGTVEYVDASDEDIQAFLDDIDPSDVESYKISWEKHILNH